MTKNYMVLLNNKHNAAIFTFFISILISIQSFSYNPKSKKTAIDPEFPTFSYAAHRGGSGLMPENTIVAMKNAIDLPQVTTLEMDLHISKDKQVVVTHNPYFSSDYTTTPEGAYLTSSEGKSRLLYNMPYDSIAKYDVGLKPSTTFSQRQSIAAIIPRLVDLIDEVEAYAISKGKVMFYDMEIKTTTSGDNINHPAPQEFADLVVAVLSAKNILHRTVLHSFDARPLKYIHQTYPEVKLSYLVTSTNATNYVQRFQELGFDPDYYCAQYTAITAQMIADCHARNVKVLAWTVNSVAQINQLKDLGVSGIVTDYPNLSFATATDGYQDTKVIITGYMPNPNGDDFSYEYVQLRATEYINFAVTPYAVITTYSSSSGNYITTAPANGWVTGKIPSSVPIRPTSQTTKFNITSGEVQAGDIFYVGGSNKKLNGSGSTDISSAKWLRVLNYQETTEWNGDDNIGGGTFGALFGNNANPQGIAVFNTTEVTKETIPVDVVFFGTLTPTNTIRLYNNSNSEELGFRICNTDRYSIANGEFFAKGNNTYVFGPTSGADATAKNKFYKLEGEYDLETKTWVMARSATAVTLPTNLTGTLSLIETDITTLPVSLSSFNAEAMGKTVRLNWTVESEKNNAYFAILRSSDGNDFKQIATILGKGTSDMMHKYNYTDKNPTTGINYYQLKQIDNDGRISLSEIVLAKLDFATDKFRAYYQNGNLRLDFNVSNPAKMAEIIIFDITGRKIGTHKETITFGNNNLSLPISLNAGIYVVTLKIDNLVSTSKVFVGY